MTLTEFREQDNYCREHNTPEGKGCDGCPAIDKEHCADSLRNLYGRVLNSHGEKKNLLGDILVNLKLEHDCRWSISGCDGECIKTCLVLQNYVDEVLALLEGKRGSKMAGIETNQKQEEALIDFLCSLDLIASYRAPTGKDKRGGER